MRTSGVIAGSLALTLVGGGLAFIAIVGALLLWVGAPSTDATTLRTALVDHQEDLAFCAAGTRGGSLVLTLGVHRGEATHVGVTEATVSNAVANCVAESIVSRNWPEVTATGIIPVQLTP